MFLINYLEFKASYETVLLRLVVEADFVVQMCNEIGKEKGGRGAKKVRETYRRSRMSCIPSNAYMTIGVCFRQFMLPLGITLRVVLIEHELQFNEHGTN